MKTLKGWSIGVGTAVALGTVVVFSSAKTSSEKAMEDIYMEEIEFRVDGDTMIYQAPSLFDAHVLTNVPMDSIRESIRTNTKINGYNFSIDK
jgi:hypothetical protein